MEKGIRREKTAIRRHSCSRPIAIALASGIITKDTTVLDYGCGHGDDVRFLQSRHISATGWDPHFYPKNNVTPKDVVYLGYVINVIEDKAERARALLKAYSLTHSALVVSARVDRTLDGVEYRDGHISKKNTFQKIYSQSELREYLSAVLQKQIYLAAPGVAYIFKDDNLERRYLATCAFRKRLEYRTDIIEEFSKNKTAKSFVELANKLGRVPVPEEFPKYPRLIECFGTIDRIKRLTLRHIDQNAFLGSRLERKEDILTYLAILRLQGLRPPPYRTLPDPIRGDVKSIWGCYKSALQESEQFLFSIGKKEIFSAVCSKSPVGKLLQRDIYVHRSAEDDLPALVRVVIFAAKRIVGELNYSIIKIQTDGRAVSFLSYPRFDEDPHPMLQRSVKVYLPKASYSVREYENSDNPPILHRKDTLVKTDYPHYTKFRQLSDMEARAGVLSEQGIGYRKKWEELLSLNEITIEDHKVVHLD